MESKSTVDVEYIRKYVNEEFDNNVKPALKEYIRIPNLSRAYDVNWETNGLLEKAANFMIDWGNKQGIKGFSGELIKLSGKPPMIYAEIAGSTPEAETILFYGHFDKQPHMTGWREGLSPIEPVEEDGKLYGRGGADDGYAWFAALLTIKTIQSQGLPHNRIVVIIEGDEESGSRDMQFYIESLKSRIGVPALVICTDSGCGNYDQLWMTNTLRGVVVGNIKIKISTEGVHSGDASGIIPETFRILRIILDRIDNKETGVCHRDLHVNIPGEKYKQAEDVAKTLGSEICEEFPWIKGAQPVDKDPFVAYLNKIWRPALSIVGIDGLPPTASAGNVLRPETTVRISLRLPPTLNAKEALQTIKRLVEENPPYGAEVKLLSGHGGQGWAAPDNQPYLEEALTNSSLNFFGKPALYLGGGGSIPLINYFAEVFPKAQFIVTGVLGPFANAHGPNEFLHIPFTKKLIMCMTQVVAQMFSNLKDKQAAGLIAKGELS